MINKNKMTKNIIFFIMKMTKNIVVFIEEYSIFYDKRMCIAKVFGK
jgi:hypothetical protein